MCATIDRPTEVFLIGPSALRASKIVPHCKRSRHLTRHIASLSSTNCLQRGKANRHDVNTHIITFYRKFSTRFTIPFLFFLEMYAEHGQLWLKHDTRRYDTRCYFNVRSKADMSQLNLPHVSLMSCANSV